MALLFCVLLFGFNSAIAAEHNSERLNPFLKEDMAFSEKEYDSFKEGQTVTKILEADTKHEIGIFSIARVNVSKEIFLRNYREKGLNFETASASSWGIIRMPLHTSRGTYRSSMPISKNSRIANWRKLKMSSSGLKKISTNNKRSEKQYGKKKVNGNA